MAVLQNRVDFCGIIVAERCNPNGDPTQGGMPRIDYRGHGTMSDVCLKRKIRDRLYDAGHEIFVLTREQTPDGIKSLEGLVNSSSEFEEAINKKNENEFCKLACEKWLDVRTFGQVFAFKGDTAITTQVRGPMSITEAMSLDVVDVNTEDLTKGINLSEPEKGKRMSSDRMGRKYKIDHGAYVFRGSFYPNLAWKTGFSEEDLETVKWAIIHMFQGDASSARPAGSMTLHRLYWWTHNSACGQYSPAKVFQSIHLTPTDTYPYYQAEMEDLLDLETEIIDGW